MRRWGVLCLVVTAISACAPEVPPGLEGRIVFDGGEIAHLEVDIDTLDLMSLDLPGMQTLPPFDVGFVQHGERLLPAQQGPIGNEHNWWEWVFAAGYVVDRDGATVLKIPFALQEVNENCLHNGVLSATLEESGLLSGVEFEIGMQTCRYLQFTASGSIDARFQPETYAARSNLIAAHEKEQASRLAIRPIESLRETRPEIDLAVFGGPGDDDVSVYGFVMEGVHYTSDCEYPYCDELALPSYSTAKSLVGGLALMRAETIEPGVSQRFIREFVPECDDRWEGVTIEHALDMATGLYDSPGVVADENVLLGSPFFLGLTHAEKVAEACGLYERRERPGMRWVYHTPDTYLVGVAISRWLKDRDGEDADFYNDLIVDPIWKPIGLSLSAQTTRRTLDDIAQPFAGYGLTFYRNDVAKIAQFLGPDDGRVAGEDTIDRAMFDAVKGRRGGDLGLVADYPTMRYNNGFRIRDVSGEIGCGDPVWVTNLSGFGGINIILMPNDTAYYRFSDGGEHRYMEAVKESHRIRPMCE